MDPGDQSSDFSGVVDSVMSLFGEVMTRDAVSAIVEHCDGDLTQAIDVIVNMSEDTVSELSNSTIESANVTSLPAPQNLQNTTQPPRTAGHTSDTLINTTEGLPTSRNSQNTSMDTSQPILSYSGASQSRGAFPKQFLNNQRPIKSQIDVWTPQTSQIVEYHNQGTRTLILMRGLPGSGKSYLAQLLARTMCPEINPKSLIFSTDDFFMHRGKYEYQRHMLSEAHDWNKNRVIEAIGRGVSPIFVDNTNIEIRHMEPYVRAGVRGGYIIELLEPNTPWAKKVGHLARKNTHDVQIVTLKRLLDIYQDCPSGAFLIKMFGLSYPADKVPPVVRNFPPVIEHSEQNAPSPFQTNHTQVDSSTTGFNMTSQVTQDIPFVLNPNAKEWESSTKNKAFGALHNTHIGTRQTQVNSNEIQDRTHEENTSSSTQQCAQIDNVKETRVENDLETSGAGSTDETEIATPDNNDPIHKVKFVKLEDLRKQLEHIERIEEEWEKGDAWNDDSKPTVNPLIQNASAFVPKPPRNAEVNSTVSDRFLPPSSHYNDWSKISMFMPSWSDSQPTDLLSTPNVEVETTTSGTCVDFGDTDVNNGNLKVLIGTPRDINFYYTGLNEEKIPNKRMLDKSSMTNDHNHIATETIRCKNEEKHFVAFRKLFKNISKVELRDIFDKCVGDVNWAVDIVLDGMANNQLHGSSGDISDTEDFDDEQCDCLAAYNIIPNVNMQTQVTFPDPSPTKSVLDTLGPTTPKLKKDKNVSESSIQLKRQIEQNVVISDNHYSDHCLKIRKMRRGEVNDNQGLSQQQEIEYEGRNSPVASTSAATDQVLVSYLSTDDEDSQTDCSDDYEKVVKVHLGKVFVSELDNMFGRSDMEYPDNIATSVNMPVSLLNEINALWIESLMYQLDQQSRQSEIMLRQDEEFARQLALKEEQLAQTGQKPAIPDLKDIMDMELALSIYNKEITAEWRNNMPNDLAARMTREKLYNLFPDVNQEILSELLVAHDNNFQATVEILLSSTGNASILEEENGVEKFIVTKELERHEKLIEEQKQALSEVDWPLLPKDARVDMNTVEKYRAEASDHSEQRNKYLQRAEGYLMRNMPQIASYYSDVAVLLKKKFDLANSLAAASLMQVHAANNTDKSTIDLHFMSKPEAKETLDLFLDSHIRRLREGSSGVRCHTLFFITGRGKHSPRGPVIKPATKARLRERGIAYSERNPGLLTSRVFPEDKLTHEIP